MDCELSVAGRGPVRIARTTYPRIVPVHRAYAARPVLRWSPAVGVSQ